MKYILEEFELFKEKGISKEEFARGKEQLKSSLIFGQENVTSLMNAYGKYLLLTDKLFSIDKRFNDINNLSFEQVNSLCYNMIDLNKICASYVGKEEYSKSIPEILSIK
jgi:predicted Zn-dependent peptidase